MHHLSPRFYGSTPGASQCSVLCVVLCCAGHEKQRLDKGTYIMHGVQQLGELEEALPGLARVVGCFSHWTPELFDVIHPHLLEGRLVLQALFWNCKTSAQLLFVSVKHSRDKRWCIFKGFTVYPVLTVSNETHFSSRLEEDFGHCVHSTRYIWDLNKLQYCGPPGCRKPSVEAIWAALLPYSPGEFLF